MRLLKKVMDGIVNVPLQEKRSANGYAGYCWNLSEYPGVIHLDSLSSNLIDDQHLHVTKRHNQ